MTLRFFIVFFPYPLFAFEIFRGLFVVTSLGGGGGGGLAQHIDQ